MKFMCAAGLLLLLIVVSVESARPNKGPDDNYEDEVGDEVLPK
jgi:hypothetical protein